MCRMILMMLLAVVSSSAAAEWVKVDSNTPHGSLNINYDTYADPATIRKAGKRVKMWVLFDNKTVSIVDGKPFMSVKSQAEYDCEEEKFKTLYLFFHAEKMGRGGMVLSRPGPDKWGVIPPDSVSETLLEIACGKSNYKGTTSHFF